MPKPIKTVLSFFMRALRQYHERPFEVAAAGFQYTDKAGKPETTTATDPEFGGLAKGT